jgi:hypothetical protein
MSKHCSKKSQKQQQRKPISIHFDTLPKSSILLGAGGGATVNAIVVAVQHSLSLSRTCSHAVSGLCMSYANVSCSFMESRGNCIAIGESAVETWGHAYSGTLCDALAPHGVHPVLLEQCTLHSLGVVVGLYAFQAKLVTHKRAGSSGTQMSQVAL